MNNSCSNPIIKGGSGSPMFTSCMIYTSITHLTVPLMDSSVHLLYLFGWLMLHSVSGAFLLTFQWLSHCSQNDSSINASVISYISIYRPIKNGCRWSKQCCQMHVLIKTWWGTQISFTAPLHENELFMPLFFIALVTKYLSSIFCVR